MASAHRIFQEAYTARLIRLVAVGVLGGGALAGPAGLAPTPVPQTGQTNVYRIGDDGHHQTGVRWPLARFYLHEDAGTVTDTLTGLMWTRDANPGGNRNWNAAVDYGYGLSHAGYDDWRLPNAHEMMTLMGGSNAPRYVASHGVFTNVQDRYWQSTLRPDGGAYFSIQNAGFFTHEGAGAAATAAVWPVRDTQLDTPAPVSQTGQTNVYRSGADGHLRAGVAWPIPRFTNHGDGTVTDTLTGLMWVRNANLAGSSASYPDEQPPPPQGGNMNWYLAIDYCNNLEWAGYDDWRLPNVLELLSLQHWGSGTPSSGHGLFWYVEWRYWSGTSYSADNAYYVHGTTVGAGQLGKHTSASMFVWPVRGPERIPPAGLLLTIR